jgi:hypothetical protein
LVDLSLVHQGPWRQGLGEGHGLASGLTWAVGGARPALFLSNCSISCLAATSSHNRGLDALAAMLSEILPLRKVTSDEALVVVSLWGRVPSNRSSLGQQEVVLAVRRPRTVVGCLVGRVLP